MRNNSKQVTRKIALYLRISSEDGEDKESNSITNQRQIIKAYVNAQDEFKDAIMTDYIDDGISGSHSNREAYKQMMLDVNNGDVDCIVVKDLSRIGRNMIDVDDLLMNHLVTLNVRFIAVNSGYDSFSNPLSNLELAVINLTNQHYNRDLVEKSITAKLVKAKRGEYLSAAPFGYKKSSKEKNKLVPDDEAAEYVRLIFSLAVQGLRSVEIAQILNAQGIPSPAVYKIRNGGKNVWSQIIDPDFCFWTNGIVYKLIKNEVYTGKAIANKTKVIQPGTTRSKPRPKDEWIIAPNAHEPLVSDSDFQKAQLVVQKQKYFNKPEHIFGNKVKCPHCLHAMIRFTKRNPHFKCGTARFTNQYGCQIFNVLQSDIEKIVIASIQVYANALLDREALKQAQFEKSLSQEKELEKKIAAEQKAIEMLETSVTKIYTDCLNDKISKEVFRNKKEIISDTIARKRSDIEKWNEQISAFKNERNASENTITTLAPLRTLESLNREIINLLIDKILVHNENDIEIVWNGKFSDM